LAYNVVCDLTDDFRQFFRVDRYQTYNEFHDLLVAFQARHTVRWPADAVDRQHLVYARAHFECVRYGWSESSATSRPVVSKRIGCKAYVVIQTYKGWVEIFHLNMQHNHEITHEDAGHIPRQPRRFRAAVTANKQENHQDIKSVIDLGDYAYVGTPGESVGPPPEFIPQSIRRLRRRPRSQLPATSEGNSGKEEEGVENYLVEDGEMSAVRHHEQALREDTEQTALLNGHVNAIRQLAVDFCLVDPNGEVSDLALDMCEELRQMEMEWRRALV
uniref:FAR1 domain-containing protein n=1 Tax=Mesocestoides corti TaxID=53468 RepID=A0A5K3FY66_MESCO